jgi:mannose-6-phosphate isomerase-like protein (cupin superfamily)
VFIRRLDDCEEFVAGDLTRLREILHPDKFDLQLRYSLAHAVVGPGEKSLPHRLRSSEVYYILSGEGIMHIDDRQANVRAGDTVYVPPHALQWIESSANRPLAFLCIVDPAWRAEDEEVV